jgi:hypothetical protein
LSAAQADLDLKSAALTNISDKITDRFAADKSKVRPSTALTGPQGHFITLLFTVLATEFNGRPAAFLYTGTAECADIQRSGLLGFEHKLQC